MIAWKKSSLLRKSAALAGRVPRFWAKHIYAATDGEAPVLLANSFPKSGTHLLTQVLASLPGARFYGTFVASLPSLTLRERSDVSVRAILEGAPAGEMIPAHLFHKEELAGLIEERGIASFFIFRDPRDVVCSETHYLTHMNRWHRAHRTFARAESDDARLELAIRGLPREAAGFDYPDIGRRFAPYAGWLTDPSTLAVRFEELTGAAAETVIDAIAAHYLAACIEAPPGCTVAALSANAQAAIAPERSHTFRRGGGAGNWRRKFSERHKDAFKEVAGDLLIELGYETGSDW